VVQIVLQGHAGWLVFVMRTVLGGARLARGAWVPWQPPGSDHCGPEALAASTATDVVALCDEGLYLRPSPTPDEALYVSRDGGATFRRTGTSLAGLGGLPASPGPNDIVIANTLGELRASFDTARTWATVLRAQVGGWTELGFTTSHQGVAVAVDTGLVGLRRGTLYMTLDGGHHWQVVPFRSAVS
jgi:hypothetical protein